MFLHTAPFINRSNFGDFLNQRGLTNNAVEVGTHRGEFAKELLDKWIGVKLYCVDPWDVPPGYEYQATLLWGGETRDRDMVATANLLKPHSQRITLVRMVSSEAVGKFQDGSLDFVYLDGDHQEREVAFDLHSWWPKLREGGVLAGHDIICPGEETGLWGKEIQPPVFNFARLHQRTIYLVTEEESRPWSFYLIK